MTELYGHIIRYILPGLTKGEVKRLRQFAEEKEVLFLDPMLEFNLRGIYASMVRHERTVYDDIIAIVGKSKARSLTKDIVDRRLQDVSKYQHRKRNRKQK